MDTQLTQLYPSPRTDLGFLLGPDGRARFLHEGYVVDVHVRYETSEDGAYYAGGELSPGDVVITGIVTLDSIGVAAADHGANFREPLSMREALDYVLREAVSNARQNVARLAQLVADIDAKHKGN